MITASSRFTFITDNEALSALCDLLGRCTTIAIDTEFERSRTYYPKLALIQVSDGQTIWLIDPVSIDSWAPLAGILQDPEIIKLIHSASEDVEVLRHATKATLGGLFDTQRAAALAGIGPALSYRNLVDQLLGVQLADDQTRTNWLRRPLTDRQLDYACDDVEHLIPLYEKIRARLAEDNRVEWAKEDSDRLTVDADFQSMTEQRYQGLGRGWRVNRKLQPLLLALVRLREELAQKKDLPRRFVLEDDALIQIAEQQPRSTADLRSAAQCGRKKAEDLSDPIFALLSRWEKQPEAFEDIENTPPLPPRQRTLVKKFKAATEKQAQKLGIEPTVLASKKDFVALLNQGQLPESLRGWRKAVLGNTLLEILENSS